jgi:hypothetical protein
MLLLCCCCPAAVLLWCCCAVAANGCCCHDLQQYTLCNLFAAPDAHHSHEIDIASNTDRHCCQGPEHLTEVRV